MKEEVSSASFGEVLESRVENEVTIFRNKCPGLMNITS
jgi:hypothetical protein